jgi:glycosyltransferase involved in cell wall biosynthesis
MTPVSVTAEVARETKEQTNSILLIGFPWYTKGADLLIRAFRSIEKQFPEHKVIVLGHMEDQAYLEQLIGDSKQIELRKPVPSLEVYRMMASCSVYVSASRSEGIARVLMEAMAAGKAIIASAVGGTPYLIQDGDSGLLFESGNVQELAQKLRMLLSSPQLRSRLGRRAFERVMSDFDERAYVRGFENLVKRFEGSVDSVERVGTRGQVA